MSAAASAKEYGKGMVMAPSGAYNDSSRLQRSALAEVIKVFEEELKKLQTGTNGRVRVAEFGCSQGGNSASVVRMIVEMLGNRVDVILEDLPANDWPITRSIMANEVEVVLPRAAGDAEAASDQAPPCCYSVEEVARALDRGTDMPASVVLCGISFYEQNVPDASVQLAFSSFSMHWLSGRPEEAGTGFLVPGGSRFRELLRLDETSAPRTWQKFADNEWRRILRARSKELVEGAALIVGVPISTQDTTNDLHYCAAPIFDAMVKTMEGLELTDVERSCLQFQAYLRTRTELELPFAADGTFSGLKLEKFILHNKYDAGYWDDFIGTGPEAFAEGIKKSVSGWASGMWMHALTEATNEARAQKIVDKMLNGIYDAALADPEPFKECYVNGIIVMRKVGA